MINIAIILSECPKNTKLYSPIFGDCTLVEVGTNMITVLCCTTAIRYSFYSDGTYVKNGECMLFPSKEQRNWHKFQMPFKDGDIISNDKFVAIFYNFINDHLFYHCWYNKQTKEFKVKIDFGIGFGYEYKYATEEERTEFFNVIKEKGYKWNAEVKGFDKLVIPQFKVGDKITNGKTSITIGYIDDEYYYEIGRNIATRVFIKNQYEWTLIPNKFDLNTLIPFESKVLVRDSNNDIWLPAIYGLSYSKGCYVVGGSYWCRCIPYKGNEHLRGKSDNCIDFYKTWE